MTRQKNTPAAATAQGKTNELQNYYNNTVDGLQARIVDKLNRITDIHALNRIYDCVYRQFLKAGTETTRDFTSVALQIEDGVTMLEAAADAYGVLSEALESEFRFKPKNPAEEAYSNRLNMYFSAFSLFQKELQDALGELQVGKDELLSIKKAGAAHD